MGPGGVTRHVSAEGRRTVRFRRRSGAGRERWIAGKYGGTRGFWRSRHMASRLPCLPETDGGIQIGDEVTECEGRAGPISEPWRWRYASQPDRLWDSLRAGRATRLGRRRRHRSRRNHKSGRLCDAARNLLHLRRHPGRSRDHARETALNSAARPQPREDGTDRMRDRAPCGARSTGSKPGGLSSTGRLL
jgi:hypothetical protein